MNNITWSFDNIDFNCNFSDSSIYEWKLSKVNNKNITFKDSIFMACDIINQESKKNNRPIGLALSGGMDSQFIALSLKKMNISFTCHILSFDYELNHNDTQLAKQFCDQLALPYVEHKIDIIKFMHTNAYDIGLKYGLLSPQYSAHLYLASKMKDYYIIFGGGDCSNLTIDYKKKLLYDTISSQSTALHRLCINENIIGADAFYRFIPEIKYSIFNNNIFKLWQNQILSLPTSMHRFKHMKYILYEDTFPYELKGRKKLTGFEFIESYDRDFIRPSMNNIPTWEYYLTKDEEEEFYHEDKLYIRFTRFRS